MTKKIHFLSILLGCLIGFASAQIPPQPNPPRLVNDLAGLFSADQIAGLERDLVAFNDSTSNVICVVTTNDLGGYSAADYAYEIGDKWGVKDKKMNNGVVILIKPRNETGGEIYIAVGYDLEGVLPDATVKKIINNELIPFFQDGDYYGGLVNGLNVILPIVAGETSYARENDSNVPFIIFGVIILMGLVFIILAAIFGSKHNGGSSDSGGIDGSDVAKTIFWGSMFGGGSGRSGGGFGGTGGFGGFGGRGGFGGGGAGGRF